MSHTASSAASPLMMYTCRSGGRVIHGRHTGVFDDRCNTGQRNERSDAMNHAQLIFRPRCPQPLRHDVFSREGGVWNPLPGSTGPPEPGMPPSAPVVPASQETSCQAPPGRCKKGGQRAMVASSVLSRPGLAARPSQMIGSLKGKGSTSVLEAFAAPSGVSSPFEVKTRLPE
ncbi:unnamed protein product [Prorocentrum cordatum]|uniref:Uncharacterized protein n=1 Tax=Prorocentrum cordatum TaxID=2364126 RepID=A0ABN9S8Q9_9DINO|nr:unnamed protein product [Polarella glacialis]